MQRPFELLEQIPDIVVTEPGLQSKGPGLDLEWFCGLEIPLCTQPESEKLVNRHLERFSGAPHLGLELGRDIIVQCQSRSHMLMLLP